MDWMVKAYIEQWSTLFAGESFKFQNERTSCLNIKVQLMLVTLQAKSNLIIQQQHRLGTYLGQRLMSWCSRSAMVWICIPDRQWESWEIIKQVYRQVFTLKLLRMDLQANQTDKQLRYRSAKYKIFRGSSFIQQSTQPLTTKDNKFFPGSTRHDSMKKTRFTSRIIPLNKTFFVGRANPQSRQSQDQTYIETFHKLTGMEKNRHNAKEKEKQGKNSEQLIDRVQLPALLEGDSYFTVLDNINLPIEYIKKQIAKLKKGVQQEIPKMQQIASDMRKIHKQEMEKIEQSQKIGIEAFHRLRNMLHANLASQQNFTLRIKRQMKDCTNYLPQYYESLSKTKERLVNLQTTIFSNQPFELKMRERQTSSQQQAVYF